MLMSHNISFTTIHLINTKNTCVSLLTYLLAIDIKEPPCGANYPEQKSEKHEDSKCWYSKCNHDIFMIILEMLRDKDMQNK